MSLPICCTSDNVIRNREHLDPAAAFDEIAKILFVKTWSERRMRERGERKNRQGAQPAALDSLFDTTSPTPAKT
jgi:hypothetical protein